MSNRCREGMAALPEGGAIRPRLARGTAGPIGARHTRGARGTSEGAAMYEAATTTGSQGSSAAEAATDAFDHKL